MNKFFNLLIICIFLSFCSCSAEIVQDNFVEQTLKNVPIEEPFTHLEYNYQDTEKLPVRLSLTNEIQSENYVYEGQTVYFRVLNNVYYNNQIIIKKETIVPAKILLIITPGMNGIPASIVFGDFEFDNITYGQITNSYEVFGLDRSLWVFPLKWALTPLPPTGSLTNFILGGHVRVKTSKVITIYYHPNWI